MKRNTLTRLLAMLLAIATVACCFIGCAKKPEGGNAAASGTDEKAVKEFDMFICMAGSEINDGNAVQEKLADLYGAKIKETWLTGQTAEEAIGVMVAAGEYPDFVDAGDGYSMMIDAGALVPIDEHWDNYPNIKNYLTEAQWNFCRKEDGHIYGIPQFGIIWDHDMAFIHNDEAWWIQTRVLKWAGYPKIETMDDYFGVIEAYADYINNECGGVDSYGQPVIPYTILCEGWKYFCLENAPFFIAGYPNDGCVIVDPATQKCIDYNTTDIAKQYFAKLNEEYQKGYVDPEFATQSYDEFIAKLSNGQVLGMIEQYWDFGYTVQPALESAGKKDCTYVPVGVVAEKGIEEHYHSESALDASGGFAITTSCEDLEGALQFVNDLLSQEALTLRFWGIEGDDYLVGDDGLFYRTQEMRDNAGDPEYKADHLCAYSYLPQYEGMSKDGINGYGPGAQPSEFFEGLTDEVKECLQAYGCETYVELLNPSEPKEDWYPLWSWSNDLTADMPGGEAWANMGEVKAEYLPQVVMAKDFDKAWAEYMEQYTARCDIDSFLAAADAEVQRRIGIAQGK